MLSPPPEVPKKTLTKEEFQRMSYEEVKQLVEDHPRRVFDCSYFHSLPCRKFIFWTSFTSVIKFWKIWALQFVIMLLKHKQKAKVLSFLFYIARQFLHYYYHNVSGRYFICFLKHYGFYLHKTSIKISCVVAGLGIFFQEEKRLGPLVTFMAVPTVETLLADYFPSMREGPEKQALAKKISYCFMTSVIIELLSRDPKAISFLKPFMRFFPFLLPC